jgi:formate dehydrogenase major subunit
MNIRTGRVSLRTERHAPETLEAVTRVPAADLRAAARLYATGGNGAIYYGLGVTEHSQGSSTVMAIANLAMATGNVGRRGVGVNPRCAARTMCRASCDMGSFPHELPGYRHISDDATRALFEQDWGVSLDPEPGLRIPNMLDAASMAPSRALYVQGEDILQSDPNTHHVAAGLAAMECVSCRTCSSTRRRITPTCSCPAQPSSKRTAPSPMPSAASRWCAR